MEKHSGIEICCFEKHYYIVQNAVPRIDGSHLIFLNQIESGEEPQAIVASCQAQAGCDRMVEKNTELMHEGLVRKDPAKLRLRPNFLNYEHLRKTFKWSDSEADIDWFPGGKINAAYNAVDRHAKGSRKDKVALIYDGGQGNIQNVTFKELYEQTNRFANVLKKLGVKRQDRLQR